MNTWPSGRTSSSVPVVITLPLASSWNKVGEDVSRTLMIRRSLNDTLLATPPLPEPVDPGLTPKL